MVLNERGSSFVKKRSQTSEETETERPSLRNDGQRVGREGEEGKPRGNDASEKVSAGLYTLLLPIEDGDGTGVLLSRGQIGILRVLLIRSRRSSNQKIE